MKSINFNSNQFSYLSNQVKEAMDHANQILTDHKPISFGTDQKVIAETEIARNFVADSLKLKAHEVFFAHGNRNSEIDIINNAVLFLDVKNVYTSKFENREKLEYITSLCVSGKINVIFIETSFLGEIDLVKLDEQLIQSKSKSLISLSHANIYTGLLLPIKNISEICAKYESYFHLNLNLTIGRYPIDLQKIKPDFCSFDCSLINGPVGVGIQTFSDRIKISNQLYNALVDNFRNIENKGLSMIMGFCKAFSTSIENLDENKLKISELKNYFIKKTSFLSGIEVLIPEKNKPGLFNLIPLYIDKTLFGNYTIEKLDLKGIYLQQLVYPLELEKYNNYQFVSIALNMNISESDINYFFDLMQNFKIQIT